MDASANSNSVRRDAFGRLREDHRHVLERLVDLERTPGVATGAAGPLEEPAVRDLITLLEHQFATHMRAEEELVFPVLARALPMPRATLDPLEDEHAELRQMLGDLKSLLTSPRAPSRDQRIRVEVRDFIDLLRIHIQKEEATVFVVAARVLTASELEALATKLGGSPPNPHDSSWRISE